MNLNKIDAKWWNALLTGEQEIDVKKIGREDKSTLGVNNVSRKRARYCE